MKKLLLAVCLMVGGATFVSAQDDQRSTPGQPQTQSTQDQDQDKQQISVSELPDAVTAKLESQDFSGWTVGNAYKKMDDSNQEIYMVELKQGTDTKKVKFDRDGNEIEKGKHDERSDNTNYRDDSDVADPSIKSEESPEELESETEGLESSENETPESETPESETQSTEQSTEHADETSTEQEPQR